MAFQRRESTKSVPTHLKYMSKNPKNAGIKTEIVTILLNAEWRSITFFGIDFKYNLKARNDEEYLTWRDDLYKNFKRGFVEAYLKDESDLEDMLFICDVYIDPTPESRGGRRYELGKNRISITATPVEENAEATPA